MYALCAATCSGFIVSGRFFGVTKEKETFQTVSLVSLLHLIFVEIYVETSTYWQGCSRGPKWTQLREWWLCQEAFFESSSKRSASLHCLHNRLLGLGVSLDHLEGVHTKLAPLSLVVIVGWFQAIVGAVRRSAFFQYCILLKSTYIRFSYKQ